MLNQAAILVGGRGTRLGPLTDDMPKPLLPVGGRPFLGHLVDELARQGIDDILLLAGYRGDRMESFCTEMQRPGLRLRCVTESAGTGGALRLAADLLDAQFLLLNGDTLFDINLNDFASPPLPSDGSVVARMALRWVPDTARYGAITLESGRVTAMNEKGRTGKGLINGGLYLFDRRVIDRLPPLPCSIETGLLPRLAMEDAVEGRVYDRFFLDIGVPDDFALAQNAIPANRRRKAAFFDRDGVLNDAGFLVFVVTNQGGVARGLYSEEHVRTLHRWMQQELRAVGAHVDAFYHCPHHPDHGAPPYRTDCNCRKPEPGMLLQAMAEWPVEPKGSFLIGDRDTDVQAAQRAGIEGTLYRGGDLNAVVAGILARMA